ncbi:hypothetical protein FJY71_09705 [candidate division WOR-3 bacterium]|nr:hypothetical protein [candidate division WOR-3 bacterium]
MPGSDAMHYSVTAVDSTVHVLFDKERYVYYRRNRGGNPVGLVSDPAPAAPAAPATAFFTSRLSIPGRASETFALLDYSGRMAGTFAGERVGDGLPAGVYVVKPLSGPATRFRVVKLR